MIERGDPTVIGGNLRGHQQNHASGKEERYPETKHRPGASDWGHLKAKQKHTITFLPATSQSFVSFLDKDQENEAFCESEKNKGQTLTNVVFNTIRLHTKREDDLRKVYFLRS